MPTNDKSSANDSPGSQLCLACGICCQGIFFYHDEDPKKYAMDLEQLKAGNRNPLLPLTCLLFGDNKCLVHEDPNRPPCCRESQCQLLKRFLRNEIKLEQGKRIIEEIRKLINKILHQLPQSDGLKPAIYIITNVLNSLQLELSSGNRSNIELFMDMVTLKRLVYHHILPIEGV